MKIVFLRLASWLGFGARHPENVMAPLHLGYSAAVARRRGHWTRIIDTELGGFTPRSAAAAVLREQPDLLVVDSVTSTATALDDVIREVRANLRGIRCVAVGQHATALPESLAGRGLDAAVLGECDLAVADLADAFQMGREPTETPGLVLYARCGDGPGTETRKPKPILDLDSLPFPCHEEFIRPGYWVMDPVGIPSRLRWGFILSSRGCPHGCAYCSPTLRNSYYSVFRHRSTQNVIQEIRLLQRLGVNVIHFKDDTFTYHRERVVDLCEAMLAARLDMPFTVQTRCDEVDEPLMRLMAKAGLRCVGFGVESASPRLLRSLRKGHDVAACERAFEAAKAAGVKTVAYFMLGIPTETREEMEGTLDLCRRLQPDLIQVAFYTPYPGSRAWRDLATAGRDDTTAKAGDPAGRHHYNTVWNFSAVGDAELKAFQKRFYLEYMLSPVVFARYLAAKGLRCQIFNLDRELRFFARSARFLAAGWLAPRNRSVRSVP